MGIPAVYDSWIEKPRQYLKTRFPARLFVPCAAFLTTAALAGGRAVRPADMLLALVLALALLLQFRLLDDLSDVTHDRSVHPERVLSRAGSLVPFFVLLCFSIPVTGALIAVQPGPRHRLVLFLSLNAAAFLWHFVLRDMLSGQVLRGHIVTIKYPLFVFFLSGDSWNRRHLFLAMAAVYLCFSIYEALHDRNLQKIQRAEAFLTLEIGLLFAVSACMAFEVIGNKLAIALLQGVFGLTGFIILSDVFLRRRLHLESAKSGYMVFVLGFILVLNFLIGVRV